ncbi:MAG TPA: DUF4920 domain-containing protein [Deltaproteobacteria bacterium]|nr:DUF4920 domain-containing protein [Deltaproteobacteria bacterium]
MLPASTVLGDPSAYESTPVRIQAEIAEVCQKKGCWAVVRDEEGHSMRVTMKDHAFGIDRDTHGFECDVEGQLVKKEVDPERIAHFKEEGSKTNPEEGQDEVWELVVSGISTRAAQEG